MIICKSFLDENNLRFVEKMQYEDTDFSMRMFANAKRVKHIESQFYYYRYTSESTTHNIVCIQKIYYRVELVKRYINLLDCLDQHQWQTAIRELIKYDVYTVLRDLRQLKLLQQYYFYRRQLGNIIGIDKFVGKRSLLALKHWFLLYVFY